jgi:hypothetical protein
MICINIINYSASRVEVQLIVETRQIYVYGDSVDSEMNQEKKNRCDAFYKV